MFGQAFEKNDKNKAFFQHHLMLIQSRLELADTLKYSPDKNPEELLPSEFLKIFNDELKKIINDEKSAKSLFESRIGDDLAIQTLTLMKKLIETKNHTKIIPGFLKLRLQLLQLERLPIQFLDNNILAFIDQHLINTEAKSQVIACNKILASKLTSEKDKCMAKAGLPSFYKGSKALLDVLEIEMGSLTHKTPFYYKAFQGLKIIREWDSSVLPKKDMIPNKKDNSLSFLVALSMENSKAIYSHSTLSTQIKTSKTTK